MALPSWFRETVVRLRAPYVTDEYGNETSTRDWALAVPLSITPCSVQPMVGSEQFEGGDRDAIVNRWIIYAPPGADIVAYDRIQHNGVTYEVRSDIRRWPSASGGLDNTQLELERVDG